MNTDRAQTNRVALFDMDGSLADYEASLLEGLENLRAPNERRVVDLWQAEQRLPHIKARMALIKSQPGWWLSLPPIPMGLRIFRAATRMGFENHVLTKGPFHCANAWGEKLLWCRRYLQDTPVTVTSDKGLVYGRLLYDDYVDYAEAWLAHRPNGLVIMPCNKSNRRFRNPNVVKWTGDNWPEVRRAMKAAFTRGDGEPLRW